jgi:hypothetical protein
VQQLIKFREESATGSKDQIGIPLSAALLLESANPTRIL